MYKLTLYGWKCLFCAMSAREEVMSFVLEGVFPSPGTRFEALWSNIDQS